MQEGGDLIHHVILSILSIFLSYSLISSYYLFKYQNKNIFIQKHFNIKNYSNISNYFYAKNEILKNQGNPYGLNFKKVLSIKYIIAPVLSIYIFFVYKNIIYSLIYFIFIFCIPEILIKLRLSSEDIQIFKDVKTLVESTKILVATKMPLYNSVRLSSKNIISKRFKIEFSKMLDEYEMLGYSFKNVVMYFDNKFKSKELKIYMSTLAKSQTCGNIEENLSALTTTNNLTYMKKIKYISDRKKFLLYFYTILIVINIILIVIYPMFTQILNEFNGIFG